MRIRTIVAVALAAAAAAFGPAQPSAAQDASGRGESSLDAVVVTASRFEEAKREVTSNISVVDREFIENSSAADLSDILSAYGLETFNDHGFLAGVGIRGFVGESHGFELGGQITVLVDGRRTMTANISKIPASSIERVEIIRGPVAAQYGPSAAGGVINVITRGGKGQAPFNAELRAGAGSSGLADGGATFSGDYRGFDYYFNYDYSTRGDLHLPDGSVYPSTRWKKKNAAALNLGYTFGLHRIGFSGTYFDVDTQFAGRLAAWNPRRNDRINKFGELNYRGATGDGRLSWTARFGIGTDDENYIGLRTPTFSRYWTDARIGSGQVTYDSGILMLAGGVDYAYYDMGQTWAPFKSDTLNKAVYVLGKVRLLQDSLVLSFGGRYDWYRLREKEVPKDNSRSDKNFSPSVGVAYLPVPWLKLRAHYAEAFLMPTHRQLYIDAAGGYIGNPDLVPETSKTWEFGLDMSWQELNFSATYFRTDSENLISAAPANVPGHTSTYVNINRALREGVELEVNADLGPRLIGEGYSLRPYVNLNVMTKYRDRTTGRKLLSVPDKTAGFGLSFATPGNDLSAAVRARYYGENLYSQTVSFGKTTVVDLALSKRLADLRGGGSLSLKVAVNNVFNEYYQTYYGYPNAGRNFYVGAVYNY
jgi:vitamin B12 transporter